MRRPARMVVFKDSAGMWRWKLIAPNGRIIADSGEGYYKRRHAKQMATKLAVWAANAILIVAED